MSSGRFSTISWTTIRRASETIQRIRKWLQKGDPETVLLDVNKVILEVASLLKSDAVIRNLRVDLRLSECPLIVRGDPQSCVN